MTIKEIYQRLTIRLEELSVELDENLQQPGSLHVYEDLQGRIEELEFAIELIRPLVEQGG